MSIHKMWVVISHLADAPFMWLVAFVIVGSLVIAFHSDDNYETYDR